MENAGRAVASAAAELCEGTYGRRAVVVCGKGNNGGDGLVAARHLSRWGMRVAVLLLEPAADLREPAAANAAWLSEDASIRVHPYSSARAGRELDRADVAIDAIFGTGFLPHRATTLGLPGLVTVVLLVVACLGRRPLGILLAGILAALLAPFQFFAFPATYLIVALYVLTTGGWRRSTVWRDGVLFLAPIVLAAPFILDAISRQGGTGAFRPVLGWSEARIQDGPAAVAFFYLTNLGIPTVLAVIAAFTARGMPARWFLVAWMVALFIVPNIIVVSAVDFDMNKYFQIMWIAVAILAAWCIRRWPRPIIAAVLVASALSPALIAIWHVRSDIVALTLAQEKAGRWIAANTPERSVFVTDAYINSPVDLAGRLRVSTFGPYVANLGYDPAPREADILAVYCDGPEVAVERMANYGATYVLSSGGALDCSGDQTDFFASPLFETVYDEDGVTIWRLAEP
jgi:hypothetical protein